MPPGEFWQFLGESIGVNPTPVAFAEVYTALQTGAIDGQDNPLVVEQAHEVRRGDDAVRPDRSRRRLRRDDDHDQDLGRDDARSSRRSSSAAAEKAIDDYTAKFEGQEKDVVEFFKAEGKKVYTPDVDAFRTYAQKKYVDKYGQRLAEGRARAINAL